MSLLDNLKQAFFKNSDGSDHQPNKDELNHIAAAALMIEIAIMDDHFDEKELAVLTQELITQFKLDAGKIGQLITTAQDKNTNATSLYEFTRQINDEFSLTEKFDLVAGMWRIAFADGDLDKYEEYMIRKVSDLIHMHHNDFIRAKHVARQAI
jgi:uncharacterized tellurite resistance protein B-like protein